MFGLEVFKNMTGYHNAASQNSIILRIMDDAFGSDEEVPANQEQSVSTNHHHDAQDSQEYSVWPPLGDPLPPLDSDVVATHRPGQLHDDSLASDTSEQDTLPACDQLVELVSEAAKDRAHLRGMEALLADVGKDMPAEFGSQWTVDSFRADPVATTPPALDSSIADTRVLLLVPLEIEDSPEPENTQESENTQEPKENTQEPNENTQKPEITQEPDDTQELHGQSIFSAPTLDELVGMDKRQARPIIATPCRTRRRPADHVLRAGQPSPAEIAGGAWIPKKAKVAPGDWAFYSGLCSFSHIPMSHLQRN